MKPRTVSPYFSYFETGHFPPPYRELWFHHGEGPEIWMEGRPANGTEKVVFSLLYLPEWFQPVLAEGYLQKCFRIRDGFGIRLDGFRSAGEYLSAAVQPRLRSSIRSKAKQLESDFQIRSRHYLGAIDRGEFDAIMAALKAMMVARFDQKGQVNERVGEWERICRVVYPLILAGHASLYVLRDGEKPIAISLNYLRGPVFFFAIASYDTGYARYGLGHQLIYRQLDWCLEQGYRLFDMSMGDLRYKHDWCNYTYGFGHCIAYPAASPLKAIQAGLWHLFYRSEHQLKKTRLGGALRKALALMRQATGR